MNADLHLDTGALALGAMPDDEAAAARAHAETCESCAPELAGFLETTALLGSVAAEAPPASLRASIMARIAVTPQLPPLTTPVAPVTMPAADDPRDASPSTAMPGRGTPVVGTPAAGTPVAATPVAGVPDARKQGVGMPGTVVPLRRWYRRPGALVAAAIAAVVLGGGAVVAVNRVTGQGEPIAQTPEQCVAKAADRQELTPAKGQGTATYSPSCNAVLLDVTGLPGLPADRTYQLWAIADNRPRSLGVLPDASAGKPQVVAAATNPGESVVAITTEPAGGSAKPTTDILWQTALTTR